MNTYSGRNEGCTFKPPYLTLLSILLGTNSPKDTTIIRLIDLGGCVILASESFPKTIKRPFVDPGPPTSQFVKVFIEYVESPKPSAALIIGATH